MFSPSLERKGIEILFKEKIKKDGLKSNIFEF